MRKNGQLKYHVLGWVIAWVYMTVTGFPAISGYWWNSSSPHVVILFSTTYTISQIVVFYYCFSFILPGCENKKKRPWYLLAGGAAPFIFMAVRYSLEQVLCPWLFGVANYGPETTIPFYILDNIYRGLPPILISVALWGLLRANRRDRENRQLRMEKTQAELAFLRSQINPHFLYNTLNYIYSLAYPVSEKMGEAVTRLSKLMRYVLHENAGDTVDLQKEVEHLENYMKLFEMRFEDRFFVQFNKEIGPAPLTVAPLLLLPFVENAFKHGVLDKKDQPVNISLKVTGKLLQFVVSNRISHQQKDPLGGVGLNNLRRRLMLLYPGRHILDIEQKDDYFTTSLTIQL